MEMFIIIALFTLSTNEAASPIQLVYPRDEMLISTEKTELIMSFRMKVPSELKYYTDLVDHIKAQISSIDLIPGIKDQPLIRTVTHRQISQSVVTADAIIRRLTTIAKYRSDRVKTPTDLCNTEVAHNLDLLIFSADNFITTSITALGTDYTTSNVVPGNGAYVDIINALQDSYLHLRNIEDKAGDFLDKLEALTSGQVSPSISTSMQLSDCIEEGEIDKVKLKNCEKTSEGLLCHISVEVYKKSTKYLAYIPVNYNGVELLLPQNKYLVRSEENEYGMLTCRDEDLELINDCTYSTWEPTKEIFGSDPLEAVNICNFTLADPPLPQQLQNGSVLIMDKRVRITTKSSTGEETEVTNVSPMVISFAKTLSLTTVRDKTRLKFQGGTLESGTEILTSNLNASTIAKMHEKAMKKAFVDMDWVQILKYFTLVTQMVVLPVALTTCIASVYAIVKSILKSRRRKRREKIEKKYSLRRNYELNKRVAKKMRKRDS